MLPSKSQLEELRDLLLEHAVTAKTQYRGLKYLFERVINEGQETNIGWDTIYSLYTEKELANHASKAGPKGTVTSLMRDIKAKVNAFYVREGKKQPSSHNISARFRPLYLKEGNYTLDFEPWEAPHEWIELVPLFWKPHLAPKKARTLYPEPFFLRDEQGTYFRNAKMGTAKTRKPKALGYLQLQTLLRPGYSYVPAGIVRSMVVLGSTLRHYNKQQQSDDYFSCDVATPSLTRDSTLVDLILLATPTSVKLVGEFLKEHVLTFDSRGVRDSAEAKRYDDGPNVTWGICTRRRENSRDVTIVAAKHGRSIEAITRFLTLEPQLGNLMVCLQRVNNLPGEFQILFRIDVTTTDDGPSFKDAEIETVYVKTERVYPSK